MNAPAAFTVKHGVCYALYAYDVGMSIDLDRCRRLVAAGLHDSRIRSNPRTPKYFDYRPAPLLISLDSPPPAAGPWLATPGVDLLLYDFGAVSVSYRLPFTGGFDTMLAISCTLAETRVLFEDSRQRIADLLAAVHSAVASPRVADVTEDYAVFQVENYASPVPLDHVPDACAADLARILRAERGPLSGQEMADALACRLSYDPEDLTLIDWNAAVVFDRDADDVRAVLEFANVELLEMRFLDHRLDDALDRSYETVGKTGYWRAWVPGRTGAGLRRVSRMQIDGAILFERVTNAPKLLGDQYLARVYRLASQRFHLAEWNATTLRKLDALETIYQQIHDRASGQRMELLEWIIILLFVLDIVFSFLPGH